MYEIEIDSKERLVRVRITDVLFPSDTEHFNQTLANHASAARLRFKRFRLLADGRDGPVQPQATAILFVSPGRLLDGPDEKWAVVVNSVLMKMQVTRLMNDPRAQAFVSMAEAEAWLAES